MIAEHFFNQNTPVSMGKQQTNRKSNQDYFKLQEDKEKTKIANCNS